MARTSSIFNKTENPGIDKRNASRNFKPVLVVGLHLPKNMKRYFFQAQVF